MFQPHLNAGGLAGTGGGTPIQLEPVNTGLPASDRVTNTVDAATRQSWWGFGWGLGPPNNDIRQKISTYRDRLFTELGTTVLRSNNPSDPLTLTMTRDITNTAQTFGVDTMIATGYWARIRQDQVDGGGSATYTPTQLADAIHAAKVAGTLITHVSLQNEPEGNADNSLNEPGGANYDMVAKYTEFRNRLDFHGHGTAAAVAANRVWIIGCEWAHFGGFGGTSTFTDHDLMHAAGFVPSKLAFGAGHCYSDCPTPGDYDSRWMLRSIPQNSPLQSNGLWSTETGIFGTADVLGGSVASSGQPHTAARMIAGLNHGTVVEVAHQGVPQGTETPTETNQFQSLIQGDGRRHPWHSQARVVFGLQLPPPLGSGTLTIPRFSVFRRVRCSDRPPGLPTTEADLMIRNTNGALPRVQAACCQRPDGRWSFVACNATHGTTEDLGNHLGSHYVAATIQITVNFSAISELAAKTMKWWAYKCNMAGTLTTHEVNQVTNLMRFTLAAGETIGLVSQEATSGSTFAAGTLTFAQAPTDAETFDPVALTQASTASLGITGIRHNLLMTRSDTITWNPARFTSQWNAMQAAGLKLYLCLFDGGSGGPYPGDDPNSATAADERTAWANVAVTALLWLQANYPGLLAATELWNEPDGGWPVPADKLVLLAAELRARMRAQTALNSIPLAAPATVAGEGAYWQTLVADGLLNHVDWVSHHMYSDPHVLERRIANLRAKLPDPDAPIFISEFGGNFTANAHEVAGSLTMLRALGIHGASHFTLKDYTTFPDNALLDTGGGISTQGTVWRTWHQTIGGGVYAGRDSLPANIQCHRFTVGGATVRVAWASLGAPIINITGTYTAKDAFGATITAGASQTLGVAPIYLTGNVTVIYAPSQETLLAYPEMDFSLTQGQAGWTYQSLSGSTYTNAVADTVENDWMIPTSGVWHLGPTTGHPGAGAVAAVRKWTVPVVTPAVARVRVAGTWARGAGGDGSDVTLLHNAVIRFRRAVLLNATATIAQVFNAVAGDVLEFRVGPGPATDVSFDSTVLRALIYSSPTGTLTGVDIL